VTGWRRSGVEAPVASVLFLLFFGEKMERSKGGAAVALVVCILE
jgi:hypothetical protein